MTCAEVMDCLPKPPPGKSGFLVFDGEHWTTADSSGPNQAPVFDANGKPAVINQDALACGLIDEDGPPPPPPPLLLLGVSSDLNTEVVKLLGGIVGLVRQLVSAAPQPTSSPHR